jgi:hypothetical protein
MVKTERTCWKPGCTKEAAWVCTPPPDRGEGPMELCEKCAKKHRRECPWAKDGLRRIEE